MGEIGSKIEKFMLAKGLSKAALGRDLGGYSGQLIGQYIAGRQRPKVDFYEKWREVFGFDLRGNDTNVSHGTLTETNGIIKELLDRIDGYKEAIQLHVQNISDLREYNQILKDKVAVLEREVERLKKSLKQSP